MEQLKTIVDTWLKTNCNEHKEKKNGFDYLSWVWGWAEALKVDPNADFVPVLTPDGQDYWSDGKTARVYVDVTILGATKRMWLPVMDFRNQAIPVERINSCDVNKAIMRCAVKCLAKFGLGLYIYGGDDLPEDAGEDLKKASAPKPAPKANPKKPTAKAVQAWQLFRSSMQDVSDGDRNAAWRQLLADSIGKVASADITDSEWDVVLSRLKPVKEDAK